jgi:pimeloyl-ACP methyl ester carboxylesterase
MSMGRMVASDVTHRTVHTNGVFMHVAEAGSGPPVVLCHGFPELWYSWRHQLRALSGAGFRVLAPDQRGYGETDAPQDVEDYDVLKLTGDLIGLLDQAGEERAVFVGHDWGAALVWQLPLLHPERVRAVVGMSVPFTPRPPIPPIELLRAMAGDRFFYMLYFQEVGPADDELSRDPRRFLARMMWSSSGDRPRGSLRDLPAEGTGLMDVMDDPPTLPPWLSEEDLDVYVSAFSRTGFTGALNWYRNLDRNWELLEPSSGRQVEVPALFLTGQRDPVARFMPSDLMDGWVPDLRGKVVVPGAGHWVQQERPDDVNRALLEFLSGLAS